ncbi:hypothetical protein PUN28_002818 [Cardiocondyla obscurior]|uniref:Uncharacterized protein n=1 Tax=Cardiocondyla obscurior TaxID=286306 RepID=A0AAW2GW90_9HYME
MNIKRRIVQSPVTLCEKPKRITLVADIEVVDNVLVLLLLRTCGGAPCLSFIPPPSTDRATPLQETSRSLT